MLVIPFFFFLFGLIIGSFLNVVVLRTEKEESLTGRSHCPKCGTLIHWYDNIPVLSYLLLAGRCRNCQQTISLEYPLIEFCTGILFLFPALFVFDLSTPTSWIMSGWWAFLLSILLIITVYDLKHMEIPLSFLLWGIGGTLAYFGVISWIESGSVSWQALLIVGAVLGGAIAASFFYLLVWMSHERWMGMGDVWLAFLSGLVAGPHLILLLLTLAFGIGAIVSLGLMFWREKTLSSQVPFAPYLASATVVLLLLLSIRPWWLSLFFIPPGL